LALILAAAVLWPRLTPPGQPESIRPELVLSGVPGMDRRVRDAIPTGQTTRTDVAVGPDAVWVLNRNRLPAQDLLVRVDPATDQVVARIPVGRNALRVTVGEGSVWVLRSSPGRADLVEVDPARNLVVGTRQVWATSDPDGGLAEQLVVAGGSAWFVAQPGLVRYDLRSNAAQTVLPASSYSPQSGLAAAGDSIWVAAAGSVVRVRTSDAAVLAPINLAALGVIPIDGLASGGGTLWVFGYGQAVNVDPATGRVVATAELRTDRPADLQPGLVAADSTVVAARSRTSLYLLDPAATRAQAPVPLPGTGSIGVGAGAVWVTDNARGRLLRVDPQP
ncbi:MAG TPA: hypothetical protein VJ735_06770, partial [Actinomycetes bacterium]|nr:hypothetical protein [Actinomycetes bacterium]